MNYDIREPSSVPEAISIIDDALCVIYGQVEFYRGDRKRAWNGEFVTHSREEAAYAIEWLLARPTGGADG